MLSKKMFMPPISNPIAAISPKLSARKSLTFIISKTAPSIVAAHASHFKVVAALIPLLNWSIASNPCPFSLIDGSIVTHFSHFVHVLFNFFSKKCRFFREDGGRFQSRGRNSCYTQSRDRHFHVTYYADRFDELGRVGKVRERWHVYTRRGLEMCKPETTPDMLSTIGPVSPL